MAIETEQDTWEKPAWLLGLSISPSYCLSLDEHGYVLLWFLSGFYFAEDACLDICEIYIYT